MKVKQKELVLVSFPFSDLTSTKVRPVLIISNDEFNKQSEDCLAVPLTTVLKDVPYSFTITQDDMKTGKLITKSRIRIDKITAIKKDLIKMKIGLINSDILEKIKIEFKNII